MTLLFEIPLPFPHPEDGLNPAVIMALLVPVVLAGLDRLGRATGRPSKVFLPVSTAVVLAAGAYVAWMVVARVRTPPEFDFLANWIPARAAAHGLNFYDPASYRAIAPGYSPDFKAEILDVGFWYPPPTMLVVLPMGLLAVHQAALLWYSVQLAALAACAVLLWKAFFPRSGLAGLVGCSALLLLLRSTFSTLGFAQTNFTELLCLVGFWQDRDRPRGGVWLALAVVVKPFALALAAFLAIRRRWSGLATAFGTLLVLMLVALVAFGSATTATYFQSSPVTRMPDYVYSQDVNQSLWGLLLRWRDLEVSPLAEPVRAELLAAACIFVGLTTWAALGRALDERLLFTLVLTSGLMLYPGSLEHYSVLLLLPILMLWARAEVVPGGRLVLGAVVTMIYVLIGIGYEGVFWAYGLIWVALFGIAAKGAVSRPAEA